MMACPEPRMAIEKAFLGGLSGTHRVAITGGRLTLTPAAGAPLVFAAEPEPTLEGVTWKVTGFNNGRQAVVSAVTGTTLTLTSSRAGWSGGAAAATPSVRPTRARGIASPSAPAATTRKACGAEEGVMEQERQFLAALKTAQRSGPWRAARSTSTGPDGERVLMATGQRRIRLPDGASGSPARWTRERIAGSGRRRTPCPGSRRRRSPPTGAGSRSW